jgi:hypothetical protein
MCKSQVYGNATPSFFRQAIGVDARQRLDKRRFSMIDMASGSEYDSAMANSGSVRVAGHADRL